MLPPQIARAIWALTTIVVIAGVALTFVAGGVQQSRFDLHRHLNHNDLQHLVQMVAVWFLCKGGSHLADTPV